MIKLRLKEMTHKRRAWRIFMVQASLWGGFGYIYLLMNNIRYGFVSLGLGISTIGIIGLIIFFALCKDKDSIW